MTHRIQLSNKGFGTGVVAFSRDSALLATVGHDTGVALWDANQWIHVRAIYAWEHAWSIALAPDQRVVAVGYHGHNLQLFSLPYLTIINEVAGYRQVRSLNFASNGSVLAAACGDGFVRLRDVLTGTTRLTLEADSAHKKSSGGLAALSTNDGRRQATAGGRLIHIWDLGTGQIIQQLVAHEKSMRSLAISPDVRFIASCGYDHQIHIWQWADH